MFRSIIASAALIAAAHAAGDAIVVNSCSYDVYLANTPAMGGGYSAVNQVLSPGGSYTQSYTQLTNGNGWSLKLSKIPNAFMDNILQYEYTFHNDGTIWYDLSEVNGNPWDGNWEITATDGCSPRQAAYRYATDDAYGMQSCAEDATITVTLCSGDSNSGSSWGTTSAAAPVVSPVKKHHGHKQHTSWGLDANKVAAPAGDAVVAYSSQSSTLATISTPVAPAPVAPSSDAWTGPAVTVTNVHVETLTQYVTATAPAKKHGHHARHAHAHHHRL